MRTLAACTILGLMALAGCDDPFAVEEEPVTWQGLAVGENHACAVDSRSNVYCWGSNDRQQLSAPTRGVSPAPTLAIIGASVRELTAGSGYSCYVASSGGAACWGDGRLGQLGTGIPIETAISRNVKGGPWLQLSAGAHHACGITASESQCWGGDRYGASFGVSLPVQSRCTDPVSEEFWWCALEAETVPAPEQLATVSAGLWHTCAIGASGSVYCWGQNALAQLGFEPDEACRIIDPVHGDAFFPCAFTPRSVSLPGPATAIDAGASFTCAVLADGSVYCWGGWLVESGASVLYTGQLGHGGAGGSPTPVRVASDEAFVSVSTSRQSIWTSTCGVTADGRAFCWGSNRNGALGGASTDQCAVGGTIGCSLLPIAVNTDARFQTVEVGEQFACGLTTDGKILCWGLNDEGQLGDGTLTSRPEPRPIVVP